MCLYSDLLFVVEDRTKFVPIVETTSRANYTEVAMHTFLYLLLGSGGPIIYITVSDDHLNWCR